VTLSAVSRRGRPFEDTFRHEAMFYAGQDEFAEGTLSFLREGLAADEPALVVVDAAKITLLRAALGADAGRVHFADMAEVGSNPARIIPAWRDFVAEHAGSGRRFRGIGEPIYPARSPAELVECQKHEALLNVAFAGSAPWRLLCPYDTVSLPDDVIAEARRSHPILLHGDDQWASRDYREIDTLDGPLPEPRHRPDELSFGTGALGSIRALVSRRAVEHGLDSARTADVVLAVNEVATNSLRHGGGHGRLRVWQDGDALICEVQDRGRIEQPLVGRERPPTEKDGGRGLWMVNQLCDLVQIRSSAAGTTVRMHVRTR
jgi:anti-sigma regulatory factor (Ser/Thr protein kinase)